MFLLVVKACKEQREEPPAGCWNAASWVASSLQIDAFADFAAAASRRAILPRSHRGASAVRFPETQPASRFRSAPGRRGRAHKRLPRRAARTRGHKYHAADPERCHHAPMYGQSLAGHRGFSLSLKNGPAPLPRSRRLADTSRSTPPWRTNRSAGPERKRAGCETIGAAVRIQPLYEAAVVRSQPSFDHSGSEWSIMRVFRILTISSESDRFAAVVVYVLTIAHPIPRRITHDRAL
jgi:hypothetical protein